MVEEQKPGEVDELKKELADIKREMMRNELEDIKREKMRQELEEMKAEQAERQQQQQQQQYVRYTPRLSIPTVIMAVLALLMAGYMLGTLYGYDMAGEVDKYLVSNSLPISGSILLTVVAVVLAFIGFGLVTMAKK